MLTLAMCCSTTLTITDAHPIFSSANIVSMFIKGLLLQVRSDKLERYSSATRASFSSLVFTDISISSGFLEIKDINYFSCVTLFKH